MSDRTGAGAAATIKSPDFTARDVRGHRRAGFVAANSARVLMRLLTAARVEHRERVPDAPVIFAPYHASKLDPITVGLAVFDLGRMPHFLAKDSLFTGPLGTLLSAMGQIPVLRASAHAGDSFLHGKRALEAGESVVIYPQGTLTKDPELWPQAAKSGASRLAIETGASVVPIAHWGLDRVLPVRGKLPTPHPLHTVHVSFGEPLLPPPPVVGEGRSGPVQTRQFADVITASIAAELSRLRGVELPERFRLALEAWASRDAAADEAAHSGEQTTCAHGRQHPSTHDSQEDA